jgi:hypothetical protein
MAHGRKDVRVSVCFSRETFETIEELRGDIPRSIWLKMQLRPVLLGTKVRWQSSRKK